LELSDDGKTLWADDVDWTPKAEKKLSERELRYFSPDFAFSWTDPESGKVHKNVLFGGGLTNRPFVKEMQPIVADEKNMKEGNMKTVEELQTELDAANAQVKTLGEKLKESETLQLSEGGKAAELKKQIAELQAQLAKLEGDNKGMAEKLKLSEESAATAKKESAFNVLLSEGKAVAAQKDAFMKDDMTEFIKLSQPVNLKAKGSSESTTSDINSDDDDKVIQLSEKLAKEDPTLSTRAAMSEARKQLKEQNAK
jgi:phage I-like protein